MSPQGRISSSFQMRDKCCGAKVAQHGGEESAEGDGQAGNEGAGVERGKIGKK